nr:putative ribonuclease H-like domain-containing protein [Tanacetum cinerariifolium]
YVCQPPGFEDPNYPDKVYKVEKALYGLNQAPRPWYKTLAKYLLDNGFCKGKIDQTLFIKRQKEDILLVQVYVDEIIFGSTKKELCTEFEADVIFISQDKYVYEILRKFKYEDLKPTTTPMDKEKALLKDSDGDDVDVHLYRSMISDYAGASLNRKSTSGGCHFLGCILISWQCKKQTVVATSTTEAEYVAAASCCGKFWHSASVRTLDNGKIELNAIVDGHEKTIIEASVRRHLKLADADGISTLPTTEIFKQLALMGKTRTRIGRMDIRIPQSNVPSSAADEAITKEMHDEFRRATTTASNLGAE